MSRPGSAVLPAGGGGVFALWCFPDIWGVSFISSVRGTKLLQSSRLPKKDNCYANHFCADPAATIVSYQGMAGLTGGGKRLGSCHPVSFDFAQLPGSGVEESEDPISLRLSSGHEKARCRAVACYAFAQASLLAVEL